MAASDAGAPVQAEETTRLVHPLGHEGVGGAREFRALRQDVDDQEIRQGTVVEDVDGRFPDRVHTERFGPRQPAHDRARDAEDQPSKGLHAMPFQTTRCRAPRRGLPAL